LQLLDEPTADLDVPETSYSFGALIRAQAQGDFQALKQRGRRVVRLQLGGNIQNGLTQLLQAARTLKSELASGQSAA
jgi:transaldolase / glucose-6-phosphate isomerase